MQKEFDRFNHIKPALLIIDVQNRYLNSITDNDRRLAFFFINLLIGEFRTHKFPVIRIYHQDLEKGPVRGTAEFEYPPEINIQPEDIQIIKAYSDSFNKTSLDKILRDAGCNTLFLCGLSAVGCVLATRTGALNHDYKAFIVKDAIMSHNTEYTRNVEAMFNAVSYDVVSLILENS